MELSSEVATTENEMHKLEKLQSKLVISQERRRSLLEDVSGKKVAFSDTFKDLKHEVFAPVVPEIKTMQRRSSISINSVGQVVVAASNIHRHAAAEKTIRTSKTRDVFRCWRGLHRAYSFRRNKLIKVTLVKWKRFLLLLKQDREEKLKLEATITAEPVVSRPKVGGLTPVRRNSMKAVPKVAPMTNKQGINKAVHLPQSATTAVATSAEIKPSISKPIVISQANIPTPVVAPLKSKLAQSQSTTSQKKTKPTLTGGSSRQNQNPPSLPLSISTADTVPTVIRTKRRGTITANQVIQPMLSSAVRLPDTESRISPAKANRNSTFDTLFLSPRDQHIITATERESQTFHNSEVYDESLRTLQSASGNNSSNNSRSAVSRVVSKDVSVGDSPRRISTSTSLSAESSTQALFTEAPKSVESLSDTSTGKVPLPVSTDDNGSQKDSASIRKPRMGSKLAALHQRMLEQKQQQKLVQKQGSQSDGAGYAEDVVRTSLSSSLRSSHDHENQRAALSSVTSSSLPLLSVIHPFVLSRESVVSAEVVENGEDPNDIEEDDEPRAVPPPPSPTLSQSPLQAAIVKKSDESTARNFVSPLSLSPPPPPPPLPDSPYESDIDEKAEEMRAASDGQSPPLSSTACTPKLGGPRNKLHEVLVSLGSHSSVMADSKSPPSPPATISGGSQKEPISNLLPLQMVVVAQSPPPPPPPPQFEEEKYEIVIVHDDNCDGTDANDDSKLSSSSHMSEVRAPPAVDTRHALLGSPVTVDKRSTRSANRTVLGSDEHSDDDGGAYMYESDFDSVSNSIEEVDEMNSADESDNSDDDGDNDSDSDGAVNLGELDDSVHSVNSIHRLHSISLSVSEACVDNFAVSAAREDLLLSPLVGFDVDTEDNVLLRTVNCGDSNGGGDLGFSNSQSLEDSSDSFVCHEQQASADVAMEVANDGNCKPDVEYTKILDGPTNAFCVETREGVASSTWLTDVHEEHDDSVLQQRLASSAHHVVGAAETDHHVSANSVSLVTPNDEKTVMTQAQPMKQTAVETVPVSADYLKAVSIIREQREINTKLNCYISWLELYVHRTSQHKKECLAVHFSRFTQRLLQRKAARRRHQQSVEVATAHATLVQVKAAWHGLWQNVADRQKRQMAFDYRTLSLYCRVFNALKLNMDINRHHRLVEVERESLLPEENSNSSVCTPLQESQEVQESPVSPVFEILQPQSPQEQYETGPATDTVGFNTVDIEISLYDLDSDSSSSSSYSSDNDRSHSHDGYDSDRSSRCVDNRNLSEAVEEFSTVNTPSSVLGATGNLHSHRVSSPDMHEDDAGSVDDSVYSTEADELQQQLDDIDIDIDCDILSLSEDSGEGEDNMNADQRSLLVSTDADKIDSVTADAIGSCVNVHVLAAESLVEEEELQYPVPLEDVDDSTEGVEKVPSGNSNNIGDLPVVPATKTVLSFPLVLSTVVDKATQHYQALRQGMALYQLSQFSVSRMISREILLIADEKHELFVLNRAMQALKKRNRGKLGRTFR